MQIGKRSSSSREGVPKSKKNAERSVTLPTVGSIVALKCTKYKDFLPHIGEIKELNQTTVTVAWLNGQYTSIWTYWKNRGKVITETFPVRAIIKPIQLTKGMRLRPETINELKGIYDDAEFV